MNVKQIDVIRLQFLQAVFNGDMKTLGRIACVIRMNWVILPARFIGRSELGGKNNLRSIPACFHPLSDPRLTLLVLISVGSLPSGTSKKESGIHQ